MVDAYRLYSRTDALPLLYMESLPAAGEEAELDAEQARHCIQVLRMQTGDCLRLTNGKGLMAEAMLTRAIRDLKKASQPKAMVRILSVAQKPEPSLHILAVALPHHAGRAEWLIEKATELGIRQIYPIITTRSPLGRWRPARYRQLMIAAMLQSYQAYLPELQAPIAFEEWIRSCPAAWRGIAHCEPAQRIPIWQLPLNAGSKCVLIGPEGDFTSEEIEMARKAGWQEISLGYTRLRTETAAIVACVWMAATAAEQG